MKSFRVFVLDEPCECLCVQAQRTRVCGSWSTAGRRSRDDRRRCSSCAAGKNIWTSCERLVVKEGSSSQLHFICSIFHMFTDVKFELFSEHSSFLCKILLRTCILNLRHTFFVLLLVFQFLLCTLCELSLEVVLGLLCLSGSVLDLQTLFQVQ